MEEKHEWIHSFFQHFRSLTCEDRNWTLDYIIEQLDAAQLYHLSTQLERLIKRDFIVQLPEEVTHYLFNFLDNESLLTCCKVSKSWNHIISRDQFIWKNACDFSGISSEDLTMCEGRYKKLYINNKKMICQLQKGALFSSAELYGHMDRVMAVYYNNGFLATGSDDHTVRIWDCQTGECVHVLRTHSVADIKFCHKRVFTASFDTTAACWDIDTGQTLACYIGHVGAVFSIDFSDELDVVVTGSADSTVKIWALNSGQLNKTLTQHRSSWITHVYLFCNIQNNEKHESKADQKHFTEENVITDDAFESTSSNLNWKTKANKKSYFIVSQDNMSLHCWHIEAKNNLQKVLSSEEWQNDSEMALLPGLWKCSQNLSSGMCNKKDNSVFCIAFLEENTIHLYECGFTKNVLLLSGMQPKRTCSLPAGVYPQTYLGSGNQFDVFLVENEHSGFNRGPGLHIVHSANPQVNTSVPIPPDYRPSKRGSSFTLCNTNWLNDVLSLQKNKKDAIFAATMKDNRVYLINCNNLNISAEER